MVDSRYNTLIIIEGEDLERKFFTKLSREIAREQNTTIIPFCNDIYELYKNIEELDFETTTKDVILKCLQIDEETRKLITNTKFVNTYLVFDLDIQNDAELEWGANLEKVRKMLELFSDETGEYGKLFINYPMMESFKVFDFGDDETLRGKTVEASNEVLRKYKSIANNDGENRSIAKYKLNEFYIICRAHLKQANLLLNGEFRKPNAKEYEQIIDIMKIHNKQAEYILDENIMFILNTSSFIYSEFFPQMLKNNN